MTNELSIQQQRPSALPYVLGGAAVGTGAGFIANATVPYLKGKAMTKEDIIAEVNAKDKFEARTAEGAKEAGSWKELRTEMDNLNNLEEKLKNLPEKVLDDSAKEAKDLKIAQEAFDAELERRVAAELKTGGTVNGMPSRKAFQDGLTNTEYKMFKPYIDRYETAKIALVGRKGSKFAGAAVKHEVNVIDAQKSFLTSKYNNIALRYEALSDRAKKRFNPANDPDVKNLVDGILPKRNKYGTYGYNDFVRMQEQFGSEIFDISESKVASTRGNSVFKIKNPKTGKDAWVTLNHDALSARRDALKTQYAENAKKWIEVRELANDFDKKFFEANKDIFENDLLKKIHSSSNISNLKTPVECREILKKLEEIETGLNNGARKFPCDTGIKTVRNAHEFNVLKMQVNAEKELAERYIKEFADLSIDARRFIQEDIRVVSAKDALKKKIANDSGVKNALAKIEKELNGKYSSEEQKALYQKIKSMMDISPAASEAEVREQVRKALEGSSFDDAIKRAQTAYDNALASKGTSNSAAKEALEGQIKTQKDKIDDIAKRIGESFSKGGKAKWIAPVVGAVALGITALALRPSAKNQA